MELSVKLNLAVWKDIFITLQLANDSLFDYRHGKKHNLRQDVDYIQHIRVQHQVDEDVAAALRALQRRIQQLEEKVDTLHAHEQD